MKSASFGLGVIIFLWCTFIPTALVGQDLAPLEDASFEEAHHEGSVFPLLASKWEGIVEAIEADDLEGVNQKLVEIDQLKFDAGIKVLDDYALYLVATGLKKLRDGDLKGAAFLATRALQLSSSPRVLTKSFRLVRATNSLPFHEHVITLVMGFLQRWDSAFEIMRRLAYPLLWALTLGLYGAFLLCFTFSAKRFLNVVACLLPQYARGILAPGGVLLLLYVPCMLGPLWCLFAWAMLVMLLLPARKALAFWSGALLVLWALVIPVRENLGRWLDGSGVPQMLRIASGIYSESDREVMEAFLNDREHDGVMLYTYGQVLKREGNYEGAKRAFEQAEVLLGDQPWTKSQRGLVAFLHGDVKEADRLFGQAEKEGLATAGFYFNYSKIKFEALDTAASRDYFTKALKKDAWLVEDLKDREERLGMKSYGTFAELGLPLTRVIRSAFTSSSEPWSEGGERASALMYGMNAPLIGCGGFLLIVLVFLVRERKRPFRMQTYYGSYEPSLVLKTVLRIIPGGSWIIAEKPVRCFFALSPLVFFLMPAWGWPGEMFALFDTFPGLWTYYVYFLMFLAVSVSAVGYVVSES